jgi:signal transduction histidine kinase
LSLLASAFPSKAQSRPDSSLIAHRLSVAYKIFLTNPDSAIKVGKQALDASLLGKYRFLEGYSYFTLSKAYWAKANYRLSSEYGFKALRAYENSAHYHHWGESLLSLARTFIDLKNYDQARRFIMMAKRLALKHSRTRLLADVYREHSMLLTELNQYDSALIVADLGLALYNEFDDSLNISILLSRKAKTYFALGNYESSMMYIRRSIILDSLVNNRRGLGIAYFQAAQSAFFRNDPDSALYFLQRSIPLDRSLDNFATLVKVHTLKADILTKKGKPLLAVEELKNASRYKDSLYNAEKAGQVQEMQSLYELESKNKTIALLGEENAAQDTLVKNQQLLTLLQWIAITLLAALILVLIRLRKIQARTNATLFQQNKAIELQKEEMEAQAESLQNLNNLKSKLFSVISHDLRGPIASLHALLDLLLSKQLTQDEFVLFSGKLKANLGVTQRTLENLLNWSLSQMEGIRTDQKVVNTKTVIEEVCRLMEELAARKNISLVNAVHESTMVLTDPDHLQLIMRNLIHNAIKFSKTNEVVHISANCDTTHCRITVKDSGIGMTQDEINLIVGSEYFTKAGTQEEKGTGLGLQLCKEFINRNGGSLSIESREGVGTEISITLPLAS